VSIYYEEKIDHVDFGAVGSSCALLQQLRACSPIQEAEEAGISHSKCERRSQRLNHLHPHQHGPQHIAGSEAVSGK
jgi:hypothetical protein